MLLDIKYQAVEVDEEKSSYRDKTLDGYYCAPLLFYIKINGELRK